MQFSSKDQPEKEVRPTRGKGKAKLILDAMKRVGKSEDEFYEMLVIRSFNPDDSIGIKEVLTRLHPAKKAVLPSIEFDFDEKAPVTEQIGQIIKATASGDIPPDISSMFIQSIKNACDIEQAIDLKARIEQLEEMLGAKSS